MALTEHRKQYLREWNKVYRKEHPEKTMQYRVNKAINLLRRMGYTVTKDGESND